MPVRMENYFFNNFRRETLSVCCLWVLGGEETSNGDWTCGDPSYASKNYG